jgi:hypothetical protein
MKAPARPEMFSAAFPAAIGNGAAGAAAAILRPRRNQKQASVINE